VVPVTQRPVSKPTKMGGLPDLRGLSAHCPRLQPLAAGLVPVNGNQLDTGMK
jgi:hypothetical protein